MKPNLTKKEERNYEERKYGTVACCGHCVICCGGPDLDDRQDGGYVQLSTRSPRRTKRHPVFNQVVATSVLEVVLVDVKINAGLLDI